MGHGPARNDDLEDYKLIRKEAEPRKRASTPESEVGVIGGLS